jgi:AraC-like DNA-binding protein
LEAAAAGTKVICTDSRRLALKAGTAAVVSPGPCMIRESSGYSSFIVFFNETFPSDFLQQNFRTVPVPDGRGELAYGLGEAGLAWLSSSIDAIFREPKYFPCMSRVMLQETFLRMIARDPGTVKSFLATAALSGQGGLCSFMADHATENISNERLAVLCGKSLSAFRREFERTFSTTPQKWLMERRLGRARALLVSTSMTITQNCHETGFKDSAHFCRAFRGRFGEAPSRVRKGARNPR